MRDDAAALVLQARKDGARHQARGGAAQDHICPCELLDFLEDVLLDFQVLKDTFLKRKGNQFGTKFVIYCLFGETRRQIPQIDIKIY